MSKIFTRLAVMIVLLMPAAAVFAQNTPITGTVTDKSTNEALAGVTITIKGKSGGTSTNENGRFTLNTNEKLPFTLVVSYIGYKPYEQEVTSASALMISLEAGTVLGQEVVVAASRTPERILESPVSIERMGAIAVRESAAPSFYDALPNMKGVESSVQSLTFRSINTRGFNANGNTRFNQFVDGMDNQAPGLNFSVGNIVGISDLDVENAELLPGAASALYGAGGTNGTLIMNSKNPFNYQGLSLTYKAGVNHVNDDQADRSEYRDFSMRYAKAWNNKFAFKANLSYMTANDWAASDYSNFDRYTGAAKTGDRNSDPTYDGVNVYGDEPNAAFPTLQAVATAVQTQTRAGILAATGNTVDIVAQLNASLPANATPAQIAGFIGALPAALRPNVQNMIPFYFGLRNNAIPAVAPTRTGYEEKYLVDYDTKSIKTSGALHYKVTSNTEAIFQANWGTGTSVYTGSDRYSLRNFNIGQYKLELKGKDFFLRGYTTQERSGQAYNATLLGTYINQNSVPATTWFPEYTGAFAQAKMAGATDAQAHVSARQFADRNRPLPGSAQFESYKADIVRKTIGPAGGAKFNDKSNLYHYEGMYNFDNALNGAFELQVGASHRTYQLRSDGTIFDDLNQELTIKEYGAFAQAGKKMFADKFKLTGAVRYDKNENFEGRFTPRISGVYTVAPNNNLRVSYQTGYRNPTTQNQYIDLLVGGSSGVRLIGGLGSMIDKYQLNANKGYTLASVNKFKTTGNAADLQFYTFGDFKPESVQSYEIGYKGLMKEKLLVDAYYYYNSYKDFLSTLILLQPAGGTPAGLATASTYSTVVNNPDEVSSQGAALGLDYLAGGGYNITGNISYNELNDNNSSLNSEFNTPKYRFNLGLGNRTLTKNLGFNVAYRWQDEYRWSSTFAAGQVDAFGTVDAQVSYKIPFYKAVMKLGGSNILNKYYRTSYGNPSVGAVYYLSFTFDQFMR
ncbi:TonB-dependent receptor [Hufsiella ginkgonis]|uniref:TonB-dependent receptor n=1 Tax=Hufsiella ginkgonis TaxID=2695274 RepID=A0A7K1XZH3_9SPHI|nr:TonB-dependent receptor [Hufsiella ginkgonis]MXV16208.1 TonB-dependent receptor [Hufsiella ginkgonis]